MFASGIGFPLYPEAPHLQKSENCTVNKKIHFCIIFLCREDHSTAPTPTTTTTAKSLILQLSGSSALCSSSTPLTSPGPQLAPPSNPLLATPPPKIRSMSPGQYITLTSPGPQQAPPSNLLLATPPPKIRSMSPGQYITMSTPFFF